MATTRLLLRSSSGSAAALHHHHFSAAVSSSSSSSSSSSVRVNGNVNVDCCTNRTLINSAVVARAVAASSSADQTTTAPAAPWTDVDMASWVNKLLTVRFSPPPVLPPPPVKEGRMVGVQMAVERAIFDCRFFALLAVAGSLIGSVLCFVEGCVLVAESYFHYFHALSRSLDQGHMVKLLIEATDMFLVGTAMLVFGVGLHAMFVGCKDSQPDKQTWLPDSNLFGLFHLKSLPAWVETNSVTQAKSRIGHAVMIVLQVGLLDKFKSIPLVTSFDLACFAAAVLVSSASTFLLSKLYSGDERW